MECQVEKLEHFRHILLFEFKRGAKAAGAARNICAMYGDNVSRDSTARKWFSDFKEDRFDISDMPHSERPLEFDEVRLNALFHNNPRQYTRELTNMKNSDHSTILLHFHSMTKVKKSGVWVPHALSQNHKISE